MTPQDRPARRFDEPPAYEDLELRIPDEDLPGYEPPFTGPIGSRGDPTVEIHRRPRPVVGPSHDREGWWPAPSWRDPDIAARSHLGAIVIVVAVVVLVVIAAALFLRGAS